MAATIAERLYGRFLSTVPLFSGLSTEVISALCLRCKPLLAMKNQTIIKQGQHGTEMYLLMSGEAEVSEQHGEKQVQLGFLSEGAFFGEAAVLRNPEDGNGGHGDGGHKALCPPSMPESALDGFRECFRLSVAPALF